MCGNYRFNLQSLEKETAHTNPSQWLRQECDIPVGVKKDKTLRKALGAILYTFQRLTCRVVPQRAGHAQIIASRQILQNPHLDQLPVTGQASDRQEDITPPGGGYQHPRRCAPIRTACRMEGFARDTRSPPTSGLAMKKWPFPLRCHGLRPYPIARVMHVNYTTSRK